MSLLAIIPGGELAAGAGELAQGAEETVTVAREGMEIAEDVDEVATAGEQVASAVDETEQVASDTEQTASDTEQAAQDSSESDDSGCNTCPCGGQSFTPDTTVAMADGSKEAISSLKVGDSVLAYDPKTGVTAAHTVTAVMAKTDPVVEHLATDSGSIETTPNHPFFTADRGWIDAGSLESGEHLRTDSGTDAVVLGFSTSASPSTMWDITVDGAHSFFVGTGGVLVHNAVCDPMKRDSYPADTTPVRPGRVMPFQGIYDAPIDPLSVPWPSVGSAFLKPAIGIAVTVVGIDIISNVLPAPSRRAPSPPCTTLCIRQAP
jgi:tetrahydromethanopterin S-methyltransferase subunit B